MGGYYQTPLGNIQGYLAISWRANLWWKLPSVLKKQGVTTHISKPKRRNLLTTTLNKFPDVRAFAHFHPIILDICYQFFLEFLGLATNTGQPLSMGLRIRPRYLNTATLVSGQPYAQNTASVPARTSSTASLRRFISATLPQRSALKWSLFRYANGTRISQWVKQG